MSTFFIPTFPANASNMTVMIQALLFLVSKSGVTRYKNFVSISRTEAVEGYFSLKNSANRLNLSRWYLGGSFRQDSLNSAANSSISRVISESQLVHYKKMPSKRSLPSWRYSIQSYARFPFLNDTTSTDELKDPLCEITMGESRLKDLNHGRLILVNEFFFFCVSMNVSKKH